MEARPSADPELEREARAERRLGFGRERSLERRLEVCRLGVERREHLRLARRQRIPALALGQCQERVAMAIAHRLGLAGVFEPRERVLAHGLQQPVAPAVDPHQRVLGECLQGGEDVAVAHPARELERRAVGEHGQRAQQPLRVRRRSSP